MTIAGRSEARERALGILYEASAKHLDPIEALRGLAVPPDPFCATLVELASEHSARARELIEATSSNWTLDRMGLIDRLVLELAIAEMLGPDAPPTAVVIDEAVELAKAYSTDASGGFVNGILSAVAAQLG